MGKTATEPKAKRRWYPYRVRSLIILMALACIGMGGLVVPVHRSRQQWKAIKALREAGWVVTCHATPSGPAWGLKLFSDEMFLNALAVDSPPGASDNAMVHLRYMPHLERAFISGESVTDTGVRRLAALPSGDDNDQEGLTLYSCMYATGFTTVGAHSYRDVIS